ncbi:hypothetical protein, unlikely [Trypanosoma brucei brucei TREU927]|uniref:Uncharacterized protein n=1 Tax=Trypanosoma brucei brucei (strain 927/4 GUTat10.1) TaxID=185431 RepID=Q38E98_TRYB2|nr:hypothetical protein, unlikely [Trypanosoma brucei brucei TREU927]EAN76872.1 hypothetical protein, unlikely [Trypanosoma brucei brucei TREU927]
MSISCECNPSRESRTQPPATRRVAFMFRSSLTRSRKSNIFSCATATGLLNLTFFGSNITEKNKRRNKEE